MSNFPEEYNPMGMMSQHAVVNAFRTNNMIIDILIGMLIPMLFSMLYAYDFKSSIKRYFNQTNNKGFYRSVEYTTRPEWGFIQKNKTHILHEQIKVYIGENYKLSIVDGKYIYLLIDDKIELESDDTEFRSDHADDVKVPKTTYFDVITESANNTTIDLTPTISCKICNSVETIKIDIIIYTYKMIFHSTKSVADIDDLIYKIQNWHAKYMKKIEDHSQYMYITKYTYNNIVFDRIKLYQNKTFETTFIPEKKNIITQLDEFQNNTGRFSITGFPKQFTLLLTGPPGTGKTSLIKAIAHYTNRHVVTLDLDKIRTIDDLHNIMYNPIFTICKKSGNYVAPVKYEFKQLIYVLEDIDEINDCDNPVFNRVNHDEMDEMDELLPGITRKELNKLDFSAAINSLNKKFKDSKKKNEEGTEFDVEEKDNVKPSLSNILQIFDGIIESPGRIIIITSNNPEKLNEKLLRPGRINRRIHLDYIKPPEAIELVTHFIGELSNEMIEQLTKIVTKKQISPAAIQEITIEYIDDIDRLFKELELL